MKYKSIFLLFAAACLTACNSNDLPLAAESFAEDSASYEPRVSNVPIRFAPVDILDVTGKSIQAAASRRSPGTGSYSSDSVGIFCLAKYSIEGLTSVHTPTWSGVAKKPKDINKYSIWIKNELASLQYKDDSDAGQLVWDKSMKDETGFYPDNDWFAYGFVAYYPYTQNIVYRKSTVTALIKVDGDDDVCYAMAKSPKTVTGDSQLDRSGFSRSYYAGLNHDQGVDEWIYPRFEFNRMMAKLVFTIRMKEEPKYNLHVERIEVEEFPCIMKIGLASRGSGDMKLNLGSNQDKWYIRNNEDMVIQKDYMMDCYKMDSIQIEENFPELRSVLGHYELREENGEPISNQKNDDGSYKYNLTTERKEIGGGMLIPPVHQRIHNYLQVYVTLADDQGNRYRNRNYISVTFPQGGYDAGYAYPVPIALKCPVPSPSDGEITDWEVEDYGSVIVSNSAWEPLH